MASNSALHLGPKQTEHVSQKQAQAAEIRSDIEAFIAKGGVVEKLDSPPMQPLHTKPNDPV